MWGPPRPRPLKTAWCPAVSAECLSRLWKQLPLVTGKMNLVLLRCLSHAVEFHNGPVPAWGPRKGPLRPRTNPAQYTRTHATGLTRPRCPRSPFPGTEEYLGLGAGREEGGESTGGCETGLGQSRQATQAAQHERCFLASRRTHAPLCPAVRTGAPSRAGRAHSVSAPLAQGTKLPKPTPQGQMHSV